MRELITKYIERHPQVGWLWLIFIFIVTDTGVLFQLFAMSNAHLSIAAVAALIYASFTEILPMFLASALSERNDPTITANTKKYQSSIGFILMLSITITILLGLQVWLRIARVGQVEAPLNPVEWVWAVLPIATSVAAFYISSLTYVTEVKRLEHKREDLQAEKDVYDREANTYNAQLVAEISFFEAKHPGMTNMYQSIINQDLSDVNRLLIKDTYQHYFDLYKLNLSAIKLSTESALRSLRQRIPDSGVSSYTWQDEVAEALEELDDISDIEELINRFEPILKAGIETVENK